MKREKVKKLIEEHTYIVENVVRKFSTILPPHVDRDDLIGAGLLGLVQAASRYDPKKGVKFELWAEVRVRGSILDHLRSLDAMARPARAEVKRISSTIANLENELGREPEDEEVAGALGMDVEEYRGTIGRISKIAIVSLDEVIADVQDKDGKRKLVDIIPDTSMNPLDAVDVSTLKEALRCAIENLPDKEKTVLKLYYVDSMSMKDIARYLKVTESRISQIHSKAVLRLRAMLEGRWG